MYNSYVELRSQTSFLENRLWCWFNIKSIWDDTFKRLYWMCMCWLKSAVNLLVYNGLRVNSRLNEIRMHSNFVVVKSISACFVLCVVDYTTGWNGDGNFKQSFRRCYEIESILMIAARVMWRGYYGFRAIRCFVLRSFVIFHCIYSFPRVACELQPCLCRLTPIY